MNPFRVQSSLSGIAKASILILIGALLVVLVGAGVVYGLRKQREQTQKNANNATTNQSSQGTPDLPQNPALAMPDADAQPKDSDRDGLTDEEEANLGTDANNPDTDDDNLSDRAEAKVYGTDPLKADTDGDTVGDGDEVRRGDNPKGPGKLLDLQSAINNSKSTP